MEMLNKSLGELSEALTSRAISSEEITKACLKHVASCDTKLGSMLWIDEEKALKEAQASDLRRSKNQACGVLDGVPLSIKDMIYAKACLQLRRAKYLRAICPAMKRLL